MNIEQFKEAIVDAGFTVMPNDEFEEWLEAKNTYHESAEGRAEEFASVALLDYYLDNIAKYKWQEGMDEISGFGGGYEKTCQAMLDAGLQWFDSNPNVDPKFRGFKDVYGLISEDNDGAKALTEAVLIPANGDATGAMHHAAITHVLWIQKNGWDAYVEAKSK